MDTALLLKQKAYSGEIQDFNQASGLLYKSTVLNELLSDFDFNILNLLNRLTEISEIPFAYHLERVQKWLTKLANLSFCGDGFSITGKSDDILSCYNSMIVSILLKMDYSDMNRIEKGIDWIIKYQNVKRGDSNKWTGSRLLKYGGCMKSTPCYIGIVKAMVSLTDYKSHRNYKQFDILEEKLKDGLEYILNHQVFKRQSNEQPITKDILKLTFPFSYKTNIIEILRLLKVNYLISDLRCNLAKSYLLKKKKNGYWQVNSSYVPKCWIQFDKPKTGLWISDEIERLFT